MLPINGVTTFVGAVSWFITLILIIWAHAMDLADATIFVNPYLFSIFTLIFIPQLSNEYTRYLLMKAR